MQMIHEKQIKVFMSCTNRKIFTNTPLTQNVSASSNFLTLYFELNLQFMMVCIHACLVLNEGISGTCYISRCIYNKTVEVKKGSTA